MLTFAQIYGTRKDKSSTLPSKFTPFGESKALEELQNQKKTTKEIAASPPLGFPIQLKYPKNQIQVLETPDGSSTKG